jgi:hypothetical protein
MSKYTRFDDLQDKSRYSELYHDALVALWREQYERSMRSGTPPLDLPHDVQQAFIRSARRAQGEVMANALSWPFRRLTRLLRAIWCRGE